MIHHYDQKKTNSVKRDNKRTIKVNLEIYKKNSQTKDKEYPRRANNCV